MIQMPTVRQSPSPNYSPVPIRHDLVIVHRCEGGYAGSVAWLCDPRANASAHLVIRADGSEVTQLVPLNAKAWAQCAFNSAGVSLEIEGYTAQGLHDATSRGAALIVAWLCWAYAVPPVWAQGGQGRGVCQHVDLGAAGGGHHDACGLGSPTWLTFIAQVKAAYDAFGDVLPPFALHGAPGPHEVVAAPFVPATPSHGGAARNEPGDVTTGHPTASGFAAHSIAALQGDLNDLGASLLVDGGFGPETSKALKAFQTANGLLADGLIGPASWAAISDALAKIPMPDWRT